MAAFRVALVATTLLMVGVAFLGTKPPTSVPHGFPSNSPLSAERLRADGFYDAEGHLVHQARGPMDWGSAETRAAIEGFKAGAGGHTH